MNFRIVTGEISLIDGNLIVDDEQACEPQLLYILLSDDGQEYPLKFSTVEQAGLVKINRRIAISIATDPDEDGLYLVSTDDNFFTVLGRKLRTIDQAPDGKPLVTIGLFRSVNPGNLEKRGGIEGEWYAEEWAKVRSAAQTIQGFYNTCLGHINNYEVRGYCVVTTKSAGQSYYLEDVIKEHKAQKDVKIFGQENTWWEEFVQKVYENYKWYTYNEDAFACEYYHAWSGASSIACGWGRVGRPGSMTYQTCSKGTGTMIHELGHNFGLRHSQTVTGNETDGYTVSEYGDPDCRMGRGTSRFNVKQIQRLEGISDEDIGNAGTTSQSFVIVPPNLHPAAMHPGEVKAVQKSYWTYSIQDFHTNPFERIRDLAKGKTRETSKIKIHSFQAPGLPESTGLGGGPNRGKTQRWSAVELFESGHEVGSGKFYESENSYVNEYGSFAKRILNFVVDGKQPEENLQTGFPKKVDGVYLDETHSGLWYNPMFNGQGFDIDVREGKLKFTLFTFSRQKETRTELNYAFKEQQYVLTGSCDVTDGIEEFDILHGSKVIGKGQLYFFNKDEGVFLYDTAEFGYNAIDLKRIASTTEDARSGLWNNSDVPNEHLSVNIFPANTIANEKDIDRCYGFFNRDNNRWYMFDGFVDRDEKGEFFNCKVWQPNGGTGFSAANITDIEEVGTAKVRFTSGNKTCWFSIDVNDVYTRDNYANYKTSRKLARYF
jgi:hypothetical protein